MAGLSHLRSLLFAPGSDERKLANALRARGGGAAGPRARLPRQALHPPAQVPVVKAVCADAGGARLARRVIEAYEAGRREGRGAVALDGSMVDLPIVERARRLLSDAKGEVV